jgi:serine/threonine protein phosphatase PrpC
VTMQLEVSVLSKTGGREVNEDACGFWSGGDNWFCVLSDGAGGHGGGDVASKLAVRHVLRWFRETPKCSRDAMEAALRSANAGIIAEQQRDSRFSDMRATVVVLGIDTARSESIWGHIGDSRLYCFRSRRILRQTRDHSVVQSMVDAGYVKQQELRTMPQRSRLLAALGDAERFEPCIEQLLLEGGDILFLCSDGFWEYLEEAEMEESLGRATSAEAWLRCLEDRVLARGRESQDNYSAIAVFCNGRQIAQGVPREDETLLPSKGKVG